MNVVATLRYARNDSEALKTEKAYILNYQTASGEAKSNFIIDYYHGIKVRNLRTADLTFEKNGITMTQLPPCMDQLDFDNEHKVESLYLPAVHKCVQETLNVKEVYIFDYMIRKREAAFPYQDKSKDNAPQPALSAHIDYTTDEIKGRVRKYFKEKAPALENRRYQVINIWKPLHGPLRDYPMAYCDAQTLDPSTDLLVVDEVFPTVANEVFQVLHNPNHKWYYIPDQTDSEVAIFAGYDSRRGQENAVPHCAFDLGDKSSGEPRQSIEVRAFVFYDE